MFNDSPINKDAKRLDALTSSGGEIHSLALIVLFWLIFIYYFQELAQNYLFICECHRCLSESSQPEYTSEEEMSDEEDADDWCSNLLAFCLLGLWTIDNAALEMFFFSCVKQKTMPHWSFFSCVAYAWCGQSH